MLLDLCPCLAGSFEHRPHICVKFFLAFKSRNYTNVPLLWQFPLKAKGVICERVHTDIGVYMRVHIIQR